MNAISAAPDEVRRVADELGRASQDGRAALSRVEQAIAGLESRWPGSTEQAVIRSCVEWRQHMVVLVALLAGIVQEMQALADGFESADA